MKPAMQLAKVRKDGTLPWLRPDGKTQTVEYEDGVPKRFDTIVAARSIPVIDGESDDEKIHAIRGDQGEGYQAHLQKYIDSKTKFSLIPLGVL